MVDTTTLSQAIAAASEPGILLETQSVHAGVLPHGW